MSEFITRFAPSPTGHLHLGHAYSALLAYDAAKAAGGQFLLRIEDIDQGRCRPEYEDQIVEDLAWLGISWDAAPRRQSDHFADYHGRLDDLIERGLVYRCFKSRREIEDILNAPHALPDRTFRSEPLPKAEEDAALRAGRPFSWRLSLGAVDVHIGAVHLTWKEDTSGQIIEHDADYTLFGDVVLGRKDNATSYNIASVHDDGEAHITHIIRGEDLKSSAGLHRLLQHLFGLPSPIYRHHPLITGIDGKRLAKRDKSETLFELRKNGASPEDIRERLGL